MKGNMWAPWRGNYITDTHKPKDFCLFCDLAKKNPSIEDLIVFKGNSSYVLMNKYPYNNGHIMVIPKNHVSSLELLKEDEFLDLSNLLKLSLEVIKSVYKPQGCNIGMNIGKVSGAGIDEHIHYHLVPRWNGDTNFMPVFAEIKVIPEHIETSYDRIKKGFDSIVK